MRGLEKVFKRLCHYAAKSKHLHALEAKAARQAKLRVAIKRPENKMIDKTGKPMTVVEVEEELSVVTAAIATYTAKIRKIESKGCNKISVKDIMELLKDLGNPMSKVRGVRRMMLPDPNLSCPSPLILFYLKNTSNNNNNNNNNNNHTRLYHCCSRLNYYWQI